MSTSETTEFPAADCPCGKGKILKYVTTQDNPWSSADVSYGIDCSRCAGEWEITSYGTLTNRESERPHKEAYRAEREIATERHSLVDGLVDQYFQNFGAKTMIAELREMQRLGISKMNIVQFRKAVRDGRKPSERAHALKNLDWLSDLASAAGKASTFRQLRARYDNAIERTADAAKAVIRRAQDVTETLELALTASGCDSARVLHKPKLLSDNGPSYIASELAEWIDANGMSHVRGAPLHPQTQGKIERWHQTLKNRILLENYFLPGDLERQIEAFVEHYNHRRHHESLGNVTPADAYFGRASAIIEQRERIKRQTIKLRRLQHRKLAA